MEKITKLTKNQEAMMPIWAQKWIDIGLQTGNADRETFEKNIKICYQKANLEWNNTPIVGALAASLANNILGDTSAVYSAVLSAVPSAVPSAVSSAVSSAVYSAVPSAVS